MKKEVLREVSNTMPAAGGLVLFGLTLNDWVAVFTVCYVGLQAVYLLWRWRRDAVSKAVPHE